MNNQFYPQYNNQYQTQYPIRTNNNINWVQGIEGAKAFQLMPNSTTMMLDSENVCKETNEFLFRLYCNTDMTEERIVIKDMLIDVLREIDTI